jgi:hypothetical protein
VLEALGTKTGPEDDRTKKQRFHDALHLAWQWFQFCVMIEA